MQLSTNKDKNKNKIMFIFNTRLARTFNFLFFEVIAFTVVVLKILALSTSKTTLSILLPHFTIHPISNVLFFF